MTSEHAVWEKRRSESAKAFEAFAIYGGLGLARSIAKVAKVVGKDNDEPTQACCPRPKSLPRE